MRRPGCTAARIGLDVRAEGLDGQLEVLGEKREPPEAGGAIGMPCVAEHLLRLLDDLEDLAAEPKESLAGRTRRRRLLPDSSQVKAGRLQRGHRPLEIWGRRHDVVDRGHAVGMLAKIGDGRRAGGARRGQAIERRAHGAPQRPSQHSPVRGALDEANRDPVELQDSVG